MSGVFRRVAERAARAARRFREDRGGNFLVMFAFGAPVLLIAGTVALNYSQDVVYRQRVQSAADSAALAAVSAIVAGTAASDAQTIGEHYFEANSPNYNRGVSAVSVVSNSYNGVATTTVSYMGQPPATLLSNALGSTPPTIPVMATAEAALSSGAGGAMTYAGSGSIWGDPHLDGGDASSGYFECDTSGARWYSALSDAGIQVNFNCAWNERWTAIGTRGYTVVLGSHVIKTSAVPPTAVTNPDGSISVNYNGQMWFGAINIDGVDYAPTIGDHSYLGGQVITHITDLTTTGAGDDTVEIEYKQGQVTYSIFLTFDDWQMGAMSIAATNAGKCGTPGGIWGNTLAGIDDYNAVDFQVANASATDPPFNWSVCSSAGAISAVAHLTK